MIIDCFFIILWLVLPFIWNKLLDIAGLNILKPNIPVILMIFIYIFQYVGFPILYFKLDKYRFNDGVNDKILIFKTFLFTSITITLIIFGYIIAKCYFGKLNWKKDVNNKINKQSKIAIILLFLISFLVLFIYVQKVGFNNIALLKVLKLSNNDNSITLLRSSMGNNFSGYHWYYLFMNKILSFVTYIFFVNYIINKKNNVLFYIIFLTLSFSLLMATEKGPMVKFILGLFFLYSILYNNKINIIKGIKILIIVIAILVVMYINFMNDRNFGQALWSILSRTATGQIQPAYHYLEFFPRYHEYLLGKSFPNPMRIFPFEHYPLTIKIMAWHHPVEASKGIVGSMPTIFWGEMYANFGLFGVIIASLFVGFFLYYINSLIIKLEKNIITTAYFVWLAMHLSNLSVTSLSNYLLDIYLWITTLIFIILLFINGNGKIKYTFNMRRSEKR